MEWSQANGNLSDETRGMPGKPGGDDRLTPQQRLASFWADQGGQATSTENVDARSLRRSHEDFFIQLSQGGRNGPTDW